MSESIGDLKFTVTGDLSGIAAARKQFDQLRAEAAKPVAMAGVEAGAAAAGRTAESAAQVAARAVAAGFSRGGAAGGRGNRMGHEIAAAAIRGAANRSAEAGAEVLQSFARQLNMAPANLAKEIFGTRGAPDAIQSVLDAQARTAEAGARSWMPNLPLRSVMNSRQVAFAAAEKARESARRGVYEEAYGGLGRLSEGMRREIVGTTPYDESEATQAFVQNSNEQVAAWRKRNEAMRRGAFGGKHGPGTSMLAALGRQGFRGYFRAAIASRFAAGGLNTIADTIQAAHEFSRAGKMGGVAGFNAAIGGYNALSKGIGSIPIFGGMATAGANLFGWALGASPAELKEKVTASQSKANALTTQLRAQSQSSVLTAAAGLSLAKSGGDLGAQLTAKGALIKAQYDKAVGAANAFAQAQITKAQAAGDDSKQTQNAIAKSRGAMVAAAAAQRHAANVAAQTAYAVGSAQQHAARSKALNDLHAYKTGHLVGLGVTNDAVAVRAARQSLAAQPDNVAAQAALGNALAAQARRSLVNKQQTAAINRRAAVLAVTSASGGMRDQLAANQLNEQWAVHQLQWDPNLTDASRAHRVQAIHAYYAQHARLIHGRARVAARRYDRAAYRSARAYDMTEVGNQFGTSIDAAAMRGVQRERDINRALQHGRITAAEAQREKTANAARSVASLHLLGREMHRNLRRAAEKPGYSTDVARVNRNYQRQLADINKLGAVEGAGWVKKQDALAAEGRKRGMLRAFHVNYHEVTGDLAQFMGARGAKPTKHPVPARHHAAPHHSAPLPHHSAPLPHAPRVPTGHPVPAHHGKPEGHGGRSSEAAALERIDKHIAAIAQVIASGAGVTSLFTT